jgi:hypothetical protein
MLLQCEQQNASSSKDMLSKSQSIDAFACFNVMHGNIFQEITCVFPSTELCSYKWAKILRARLGLQLRGGDHGIAGGAASGC